MRKVLIAAMIACAAQATVAVAPAAAAETVAAAGYSVDGTDLGTLLDDPAAKAILTKYLPNLVSSDQIQMARSLTLKQLQGFAGDAISDENLAAIQADFDKLAKH